MAATITTTITRTERDIVYSQGHNDAATINVFRGMSEITLLCTHK